ncbi:MAG: tRNA dihydrouridine synthase DusB [Desulfofustis sp.]|nr:tRNA dihydrouridine synthase DusB [Desulfofustis sp.]
MTVIGNLRIDGPLALAPLAGYSDLPFRLLCRRMGAALCVSEMISCHGLVYRQSKTLSMIQSCAEERPVSFQLFGADPVIMAEAAAIIASCGPDVVDINMGCPVKKVTKRGAGAALMKDLKQAERIVCEVVKNSRCPVTVKLRSGPELNHICAGEFAIMAENSGAAAVAVHGRTWHQGFSGSADWSVVADVKQRVSIPVFGNGDILSYDQAVQQMQQTGCDGILIGRAAIGNPWIFSGSDRPAELSAVCSVVLEHLALIERFSDSPARALGSIKNHLGKYFRGMEGSARIRKAVYQQPDWSSLKKFINYLKENNDKTSQ